MVLKRKIKHLFYINCFRKTVVVKEFPQGVVQIINEERTIELDVGVDYQLQRRKTVVMCFLMEVDKIFTDILKLT